VCDEKMVDLFLSPSYHLLPSHHHEMVDISSSYYLYHLIRRFKVSDVFGDLLKDLKAFEGSNMG